MSIPFIISIAVISYIFVGFFAAIGITYLVHKIYKERADYPVFVLCWVLWPIAIFVSGLIIFYYNLFKVIVLRILNKCDWIIKE